MHHRLTFSEKLIRCLYCGRVLVFVEQWLSEECPRSRREHDRDENQLAKSEQTGGVAITRPKA